MFFVAKLVFVLDFRQAIGQRLKLLFEFQKLHLMLVEFQSTALNGADLVANRTCLFVILRFNRPLKGRTQSLELEVAFGGPPKILRNLTYVLLSAMDVHKQRFEVLLEDHVVIGAAKSPPFSKLGKSYSAHRASLLVGLGQFAGRFF